MEKRENSFYKGAFSLSVSALLVKIVGVLYKVPLSYLIGEEGMGYFNAAYTLYGFFFIIFSSGLPKAVTMTVSDIRAEGVQRPFRFALRVLGIFVLFAFLLSLILLLISPFLASMIGNMRALYSIRAILPSLIFISASGVLRGYLNGIMELGAIALSQLIEAFAKLLFGLGFAYLGVRLGLSLEGICALSVFGITISTFVSFVCLLIKYKNTNKTDKQWQSDFKHIPDFAF